MDEVTINGLRHILNGTCMVFSGFKSGALVSVLSSCCGSVANSKSEILIDHLVLFFHPYSPVTLTDGLVENPPK